MMINKQSNSPLSNYLNVQTPENRKTKFYNSTSEGSQQQTLHVNLFINIYFCNELSKNIVLTFLSN